MISFYFDGRRKREGNTTELIGTKQLILEVHNRAFSYSMRRPFPQMNEIWGAHHTDEWYVITHFIFCSDEVKHPAKYTPFHAHRPRLAWNQDSTTILRLPNRGQSTGWIAPGIRLHPRTSLWTPPQGSSRRSFVSISCETHGHFEALQGAFRATSHPAAKEISKSIILRCL